MKYDVMIIGCGLIGASIARQLAKYNLNIIVVEKNKEVALETTAVNSGLIHGGFDPKPKSLSAILNMRGKKLYEENWFKELHFSYKKVNSLLVAFDENESSELLKLHDQGLENGLDKSELKILSKDEVIDLEPSINPEIKGGLLCTSSYLIDPVNLTKQLINNFLSNSSKNKLLLSSKVVKINKKNKNYLVELDNEDKIEAKNIINCAGHWSDEIASLINKDSFKLRSRRGQYIILDKLEVSKINNVVFMIPTIHGKGVIVAPLLDGTVMVGPSAEELPTYNKDETMIINLEMNDKISAIGKKIIPNLNFNKIVKIIAGSRPIDIETNEFIIDYANDKDKNFINVAGIKSPGISAAPAIAERVIELLSKNGTKLIVKDEWDPKKIY